MTTKNPPISRDTREAMREDEDRARFLEAARVLSPGLCKREAVEVFNQRRGSGGSESSNPQVVEALRP